MRIVIADPNTGKSYQKEIEKDREALFMGKRIGEQVAGEELGLSGYLLELTGGSDQSGFPMRRDISGGRKMQVLVSGGVGFHPPAKGARRRKTLRGNTYTAETLQINACIVQAGAQKIEELMPPPAAKKA